MANVWLLAFFVTSAIVMIVKFLYTSSYILEAPHWFKVNYPAGILRPALMYLYVRFLLRGSQKVKPYAFLHFVPMVLLTLYLLPFFLQSAEYKTAVLKREVVNTLGLIPSWYVYFQIVYSTVYLALIFNDFRKFTLSHPRPSKSHKSLRKWIRLLLVGGVIYLSIIILIRLFDLTTDYNHNLYEVFSILLVLLCIKLLTHPEWINTNVTANTYQKSWLTPEKIDTYFSRIDQLMKSKKIYRREDLKLRDIATELAIPEYLISQIINQKSGQSFRNYLNTYRIQAAKEMLLNSRKYSIEGIAKDVGFNTRASFYTAFKKETNLTPSEFVASDN